MTDEGLTALTELLSAARSEDVAEPSRAGRSLASLAEEPRVRRTLRQLLLDADNTAVTVETAEALLTRWDLVGVREVASALVVSDDELTTSWLIEAVQGVFMQS